MEKRGLIGDFLCLIRDKRFDLKVSMSGERMVLIGWFLCLGRDKGELIG